MFSSSDFTTSCNANLDVRGVCSSSRKCASWFHEFQLAIMHQGESLNAVE